MSVVVIPVQEGIALAVRHAGCAEALMCFTTNVLCPLSGERRASARIAGNPLTLGLALRVPSDQERNSQE